MPPGSLKERPGYAPDNKDDELNPANRPSSGDYEGTEKSEKPWQPEGYDEPYQGDKTARPNLGLSEKTAQPSDGISSSGLSKPESALASPSPINTSKLSVPTKGMNKILIRGVTRKQASYAGGGMGLVACFIALYMAGASLYLVHLKNYLTGSNNQYNSTISRQMQRRRVNSSLKILKKVSQKMQITKFAQKAEKAGFEVVMEGGVVKSLKKDGAELILGKSTRELTKDVKNLGKTPAGRAFLNSYDEVSREFGARFMGPVTKRSVYKKILGISVFIDWIGARQLARAGPDGVDELADVGTKGAMGDFLLNANETERLVVQNLTAEDLARVLDIDPNDPNAFKPGTTVDDLFNDYTNEASEYIKARTGSAGSLVERGAGEADRPRIDAVLGEADTLIRTADETSEGAFRALASKISPRMASKLLAGSFDINSVPRQGCRVAGTLEFVKSVRNTLMAIELAKFFARFMTIADHQQAGLASSTAVKMMSIYLAGATGSTGVQSIVNGGAVSAAGVSQYGVGYADVGILAAISAYIRRLPWQDPGDCKTINNPLVIVGGTLAGGALAVLSGGSSYAFSLSTSIGLTVVNEIAFAYALPILIGSVSGALLTGFEQPGEETGNALSSSLGSLTSMTTGASAGLPVAAGTFVGMLEETEVNKQEVLGKKSFAERYLDINNSESLIARASLIMPQSLPGVGSIFQKQLSFNSIVTPLSSVFSFASPPASAQANNCEDVSVVKFNVATDGFCNLTLAYVPILDLDQTEKVLRENGQINLASQPVPGSAFQRFIDNCFSGRPGIGHPIEVKTDGSTEPIDPTCVLWTEEGLDDDLKGSFPGDVAEDVDGNGIERIPSKRERMAAWQGFLVDEENLTADINDQLSSGVSTAGQASNNKIYFLGDSLTNGMQNLAGSDQTGDYLQRTFNSRGWSADVNAQGCRAVYQTQGPITGDGSSCPSGSIVDGLTAVNSDIAKFSNDQMGTVVIGLGTNRYETDASGNVSGALFSEKVRELIDNIKKSSPSARIYWVNLTANPDSQSLIDRNALLNSVIGNYPEEQNVSLLDWNDYVKTADSTPSQDDDVGFAGENEVHHTADGYSKKVQYLLDNIALPANTTSGSATGLNCSGYKEITSPTARTDVAYSSEISAGCEQLKNDCLAGVTGTGKILCAAFEFDGTYYGNGYGAYSGPNAESIYGFNATSSNYGIYAKRWLENRSEGLSPNNLLECSGLTSVALYRAYGVDGSTIGCSGNWTARNNPTKFRQLSREEISPGDFLTLSFSCNSDSAGHVAIAASAPDENGNLMVYETESWQRPVRFTTKNLSYFKGGWSRYIGEGS